MVIPAFDFLTWFYKISGILNGNYEILEVKVQTWQTVKIGLSFSKQIHFQIPKIVLFLLETAPSVLLRS